MKKLMRISLALALGGAAYLAFCGAAFAATKVWTGGGADKKLSTAANWSDNAAPATGDVLSFGYVGPYTVVTVENDYDENTTFSGITFTNDGTSGSTQSATDGQWSTFTITGNTLYLAATDGTSSVAISQPNRGYSAGRNDAFKVPIVVKSSAGLTVTGKSRYGTMSFAESIDCGGGPLEISSGFASVKGNIVNASAVIAKSLNWNSLVLDSKSVGTSIYSNRYGCVQIRHDSFAPETSFVLGDPAQQYNQKDCGPAVIRLVADNASPADTSDVTLNGTLTLAKGYWNGSDGTGVFENNDSSRKLKLEFSDVTTDLDHILVLGGTGDGEARFDVSTEDLRYFCLRKHGAGAWAVTGSIFSHLKVGQSTTRLHRVYDGTLAFTNTTVYANLMTYVGTNTTVGTVQNATLAGDATFKGDVFVQPGANVQGGWGEAFDTPLTVEGTLQMSNAVLRVAMNAEKTHVSSVKAATLDLGLANTIALPASLKGLTPGNYTLLEWTTKKGEGTIALAEDAALPAGAELVVGDNSIVLKYAKPGLVLIVR